MIGGLGTRTVAASRGLPRLSSGYAIARLPYVQVRA